MDPMDDHIPEQYGSQRKRRRYRKRRQRPYSDDNESADPYLITHILDHLLRLTRITIMNLSSVFVVVNQYT